MPQPNKPQYGTSNQQIAQLAGMIEASRNKGKGGGGRPGDTDMSEMLRGELEAQRSSKVATAIQKATLMPGMALSAVSRMDNLDEVIGKAVSKISKVRGVAGGAAGGVDTGALTDAITKMGGLGYLGTSGIMNVPRQKQLAYEQQHRKQLGATGTASSALSTLSLANRAIAAPRVASMVYGGGMPSSLQGSMGLYDAGRPMAGAAAKKMGMTLPAGMTDPSSMAGMATGMAPMIAAQMGLGMMKARKMAKITAQRSSGGAEEAKFSFSQSLDAQINMLASKGQLQPGDQLQIQIMKWIEAHTSVLPEMWADQKYLREEKEKGIVGAGEAYSKATTGLTEGGTISKAVGAAEGFMSRTVAKYDIFGQLFNFISTGKLPKDFQEELSAAYSSSSERKDWKKTAKERGLGVAQSRLLEMTSRQIIDMAPSHEVKMLSILGASFDIQRLSASELLAIRRTGFGIPDTAIKSDDYERSAIGKIWDVLKSPAEMLTNIPGVNALWNMLKLPFSIGGKVRGAAKSIWGGARSFMLGGEETQEMLESEETLRKKAGIYKSPQEMANEFMGRGLPDIMEEMRSIGWRQVQELANIYGVMFLLTQQMTGITHKRDERTYSMQVQKGVWSYTAGKYLDEKGLEDQHKQDRERMQIALEGAFKGTGMDRVGWLVNKITGAGGGTVEERLSGAAGMVRGVEAMPYDMATGGQKRGGLVGALQMALAAPLIEIGQEMTLTPEEVMETAMYRQRGAKGRGRARVVPGWFGAEQARKQMSFEQDIWPQMQRKMMGGIGGVAAGAGAGILGGAASLATGGALLPLLLMGGLGGAAGAIPPNILEFMQTQKTFEGLSGEDIVRMSAGFAEMPDMFKSGDKKFIKEYLKGRLTSDAYGRLGVDDDEFFTNINNLGFIQMALQNKGSTIGGMGAEVKGQMFRGNKEVERALAEPGGMYGLLLDIHRGTSDPLPVTLANVADGMILKFPGLFEVSQEWTKRQEEIKAKQEEEKKIEEEKIRVRKEAQMMRGMSPQERQALIEKQNRDPQAELERIWAEHESPTVQRSTASSRQRELQKIIKEFDDSSDIGDVLPHRSPVSKIISIVEYLQSLGRNAADDYDPENWYGEKKAAAADGGVVGQTGLAYVHKGEIIGGPQLILKMLTGSGDDVKGAAGAYGRGLKSELNELKEKTAQLKAVKWMDSVLEKLGEIDENTEDTDHKGIGKKSKKKKEKGGFDISSAMSFLPLAVPAILALLGGVAGGIPGGVPGAIVGGGLGVGAGLFASKKAAGLAKTGVKKGASWIAKRGVPMAGRALGGLGRGLATGARTIGAAGLTALAGIGGTAAGAYRAQEKYGDPLGEKLSAWQKLGLGAGTGLKWATLGAIDVDKMTGTSKVIKQVQESKAQTKKIKGTMTERLEGNSSPEAKKLYVYDDEGIITNFMMLRYKKIVPSISNRYGWVTVAEADAENQVKTEIKKTTGTDVKKFTRIDNNLHKEAIRKYEQAVDQNDKEYIDHYAGQMAAWSDLPPSVQLKMLQQQEGRLKPKAGDAPKSPASKYTKSDADKLKDSEKKAKDIETAAKASIENEAKRLDQKKKIVDDAKKKDQEAVKKNAGLMGSSAGRMLAAGGSTAAAGKVVQPGGRYAGMGGMAGASGASAAAMDMYDDLGMLDTEKTFGVDEVKPTSWWGKLTTALGFSDRKFKYKPFRVGKRMGKGGFMWPGANFITSPFGPRRTKLKGASKLHKGSDMRADDVVAAFKGKVIGSGDRWGSLVLHHGPSAEKGFSTHYLHLGNKQVKIGDEVNPGDVIGQAGNVGPIPGMKKHLHFGVKKKGKWYDPELVFKSLDPSFTPEYASDIVAERQLGSKLSGQEIDASKLGIEGAEAAGPFNERYNPTTLRNSLADKVSEIQSEAKLKERSNSQNQIMPPLTIPLPRPGTSEGRVADEKDLEVTDPTLDTFIRNLFVDCAYEFNNRYKNYAYNSNVGHAFS